MPLAQLAHETDLDGWRDAARELRMRGVSPEAIRWTMAGAPDLLAGVAEEPPATGADELIAAVTAPRGLLDLAGQVILHRSEERFALLYRLLWRLKDQPQLLHIASDPDVARAHDMAREVSRAAHKMKAFVRFRTATDATGEAFVAWFEPAHRVTEATAPFFARRFANMRFSILTPDVCAHWDTRLLSFTPGADASSAPAEDALEDYWRTYYASIFNPARLNVAQMTKEMPKRYWRNLPEAGLIPELIARAEERTAQMIRQPATEPTRRVVRAALRASRDAPFDAMAPTSLADVDAGVQHCRRCDLWRDATQGVVGQGPLSARLMFVGEQPGDQEDLAGVPFVGPAGQLFDKALAAAGVVRAETYVTNAVKHFRHELRGKRRLHRTPDTGHVEACRWWLEGERRIVRPRVIVALGATAARAVMGRPVAVVQSRQQAIPLSDRARGVVTYHPAYLLRLPDAAAKHRAYGEFVDDLRFARDLAQ